MAKSYSAADASPYKLAVMPNPNTRSITLPGGRAVRMPVPRIDPLKLKKDPAQSKAPVADPKEIGDVGLLNGIIENLYKQFLPEEIEFTPRSDEEIASSISGWLRPGYDQAISDRKDLTQANNANLDADAIARGMGSSTYVSDVKGRQQNAEADDIAKMESDYGANFSKYMYDSISADQDRLLDVEKTNAELREQAYQRAYDAALILYEQYKKNPKTFNFGVFLSPAQEKIEGSIVAFSTEERNAVFEASTPRGAQYRAQVMAKVGSKGFDRLVQKYSV